MENIMTSEMTSGFNPRAREGRDRCIGGLPVPCAVSIHAPARGATNGVTPKGKYSGCFNPRAREGRDR